MNFSLFDENTIVFLKEMLERLNICDHQDSILVQKSLETLQHIMKEDFFNKILKNLFCEEVVEYLGEFHCLFHGKPLEEGNGGVLLGKGQHLLEEAESEVSCVWKTHPENPNQDEKIKSDDYRFINSEYNVFGIADTNSSKEETIEPPEIFLKRKKIIRTLLSIKEKYSNRIEMLTMLSLIGLSKLLETSSKPHEKYSKEGFGVTLFPNGDFYIGNYISNSFSGLGLYFYRHPPQKSSINPFNYPEYRIYVGEWNHFRKITEKGVYHYYQVIRAEEDFYFCNHVKSDGGKVNRNKEYCVEIEDLSLLNEPYNYPAHHFDFSYRFLRLILQKKSDSGDRDSYKELFRNLVSSRIDLSDQELHWSKNFYCLDFRKILIDSIRRREKGKFEFLISILNGNDIPSVLVDEIFNGKVSTQYEEISVVLESTIIFEACRVEDPFFLKTIFGNIPSRYTRKAINSICTEKYFRSNSVMEFRENKILPIETAIRSYHLEHVKLMVVHGAIIPPITHLLSPRKTLFYSNTILKISAFDFIDWLSSKHGDFLTHEHNDEVKEIRKERNAALEMDLYLKKICYPSSASSSSWNRQNHRLFPLEFQRVVMICLLCNEKGLVKKGLFLPIEIWRTVFSFNNYFDFKQSFVSNRSTENRCLMDRVEEKVILNDVSYVRKKLEAFQDYLDENYEWYDKDIGEIFRSRDGQEAEEDEVDNEDRSLIGNRGEEMRKEISEILILSIKYYKHDISSIILCDFAKVLRCDDYHVSTEPRDDDISESNSAKRMKNRNIEIFAPHGRESFTEVIFTSGTEEGYDMKFYRNVLCCVDLFRKNRKTLFRALSVSAKFRNFESMRMLFRGFLNQRLKRTGQIQSTIDRSELIVMSFTGGNVNLRMCEFLMSRLPEDFSRFRADLLSSGNILHYVIDDLISFQISDDKASDLVLLKILTNIPAGSWEEERMLSQWRNSSLRLLIKKCIIFSVDYGIMRELFVHIDEKYFGEVVLFAWEDILKMFHDIINNAIAPNQRKALELVRERCIRYSVLKDCEKENPQKV